MLTDEDKQKLSSFYMRVLHSYGRNHSMAVHWSSPVTQKLRFEVFENVDNLNGKSILDVGCGVGDFYGFLISGNYKLEYLGIDILPEMIQEARLKYPNGNFEAKQIDEVEGSFDYIFASGLLSYKVEDYYAKYMKLIETMFNKSRLGIAFNMLKKGEHMEDETFAVYDPKQIIEEMRKLSPKVSLIEDYLAYDFTVVVRK